MGNTNQTLKINLKGFIVANGATDLSTDPFISTIDTMFHYNLVDPKIYKRYKEQGCRYYWKEIKLNLPGDCLDLLMKIASAINYTDLYDLNSNFELDFSLGSPRNSCPSNSDDHIENYSHYFKDLKDSIFHPHEESCKNLKQGTDMSFVDWMGTDAVRKAFHVHSKVREYVDSNATININF